MNAQIYYKRNVSYKTQRTKMLYQVLNQSGYPAEYELFNPHALFKTKKECKEYISYLKSDCGLEDESFTIKQII